MSFREALLWELKQGWKLALVLALILAALLAMFQVAYVSRIEASYEPVDATIISFRPENCVARITCGIIVHARTKDGLIGSQRVAVDRVRGCQVGDRIRAEKAGMRLRVLPEACN